ncbi:hypothetical protein [Pseudescherichia vulneris]|uniref:hypothetical protein n=1 Tax=Pseudescherichia vulneris TaxID=566 RepID=UPI001EE11957|nr:hypothetical protein [Pseudescherichia vulneris]
MNFKLFLLKFILSFLLGFYAFNMAVSYTVLKSASTPWIMLTLLLFSSGYCIQALFKLPESDEHPSLSSNELRRLRPMLKIKKNRLTFILCYHVLAAIIVSLGFFSISLTNPIFPRFFSLAGGMVVSCLYTFFFVKANMDEIQSFKSKLIHRAENEKRKKDLLDSITKKPE